MDGTARSPSPRDGLAAMALSPSPRDTWIALARSPSPRERWAAAGGSPTPGERLTRQAPSHFGLGPSTFRKRSKRPFPVLEPVQPLPQISQPSAPSADARRLPFWGSKCLEGTLASKMRTRECSLSTYRKERQGEMLPPIQPATSISGWRTLGHNFPGFGEASSTARQTKNKWLRGTVQSDATSTFKTSCAENDDPRASKRSGQPSPFQTAHARDAAAFDPLSRQVRKAAQDECALCHDAEELDSMYRGVEEFVEAGRPSFVRTTSVLRLGTEVLTCITSRHRRSNPVPAALRSTSPLLRSASPQPGNVDGTGKPAQADGLLSWLPRYVKKPYFLDIVREEVDKRRAELETARAPPAKGLVSVSLAVIERKPSKESVAMMPIAEENAADVVRASEDPSSGNQINDEHSGESNAPREAATLRMKDRHATVESLSCKRISADASKSMLNAQMMRMVSVFQKLSDDNRVHKDDLTSALHHLAFVDIQQSWIVESLAEVTKYTLLSEGEFMDFVYKYSKRQSAEYHRAFDQYDEDGSGSVDVEELAKLVVQLGVEPMDHVLREVLEEVDEDGSGQLDFEEFERVLDMLKMREGFTETDYEGCLSLFKLFSVGGAESLDVSSFAAVLNWAGFLVDQADIQKIAAAVDVDNSGSIDKAEFVACMRHVRDREVATLKAAIIANDTDGNGAVDRSDLMPLFHSLGYIPDADAVAEAAEDAGIANDDEEIDISELWRLMQVYRDREGLNRYDSEEINKTFAKHEKDGSIATDDVGKVLRSIGYSLDFDTQQNLTAKVDVTGDGWLDVRELRKLVRMIRDEDIKLMKGEFGKMKNETETTITLPAARIALTNLGCITPDNKPAHILPGDLFCGDKKLLDIYGFCKVALRSRKDARALFQKNGGFSNDDLKELKAMFENYDTDHSGDVAKDELIVLLEQMLPQYAHDPDKRPTLLKLINEVDENGDGTLDFQDFVRLVRRVFDFEIMAKLAKESKAVEDTGFVSSEVQGFREVFIKQSEGEKVLDFEGTKQLMQGVCPMGAKLTDALREIFQEVVGGDSFALDFPDFLRLMKKVIDGDFAHVQERYGFRSSSRSSSRQRPSGQASASERASKGEKASISKAKSGRLTARAP